MLTLDDLSDPPPSPGPADWNDQGVAHFPGLIPDDLLAQYEAEWMASNGFHRLTEAREVVTEGPQQGWSNQPLATLGERPLWVLDAEYPGGWNDTCPYMHHPALMDICTHPALAGVLDAYIGEPAGVHLNLTGWESTQRRWHQDGYLNPPHVGDFYAAVWIALDTIHPDSGVFQFIPGSHRWHTLTHEKVSKVVDVTDPMWPAHTEEILTPLVEAEIERRGVEPVDYVPTRGDVLLWHPRLYHQGSMPKVPHAYRPALIAHYSGIHHREDMPPALRKGTGGYYFPIVTGNPVR